MNEPPSAESTILGQFLKPQSTQNVPVTSHNYKEMLY